MPELSICMTGYNARGLLADCLRSIAASPPPLSFEIVYVDNGSRDGSTAMLKEHFPEVRVFPLSRNLGFIGGTNHAFRQSSGNLLLMLNCDTLVHPGALDLLVKFMNDHPEVGVLGPRVLNRDGSLQASAHSEAFHSLRGQLFSELGLTRVFPLARAWLDGTWYRDRQDGQPREVDHVFGACFLTRRPVIQQIGLLDGRFFNYSDDTDFCQRARKAGWKICYLPSAVITHYGGQTIGRLSVPLMAQLYQSRYFYLRKHYGAFRASLFRLIVLVGYTKSLVLRSTSKRKSQDLYQVWSVWRWALGLLNPSAVLRKQRG